VFCDRCVSVVERVLFGSFVFVRDCVVAFVYVSFVVFSCLLYWSFVFHEESFVVMSVSVTASKILPEWFFMWFFGVIKCVPSKLFGVLLLVFVLCVFVVLSCVLGVFSCFVRFVCVMFVCSCC